MRPDAPLAAVARLLIFLGIALVLASPPLLLGRSGGDERSVHPWASSANASSNVTLGNVNFTTQVRGPFSGVFGPTDLAAVDPLTGVVYSASTDSGMVSVFSAASGSLLNWTWAVPNGPGSRYILTDLLWDGADQRLYLSVQNFGGGQGAYVRAFTGPALLPAGNLTFGASFPSMEPGFLALDPTSHQLFVADAGSMTVVVFNAASDRYVRTLQFPCTGACVINGMAVSVAQRQLLVSTSGPQLERYNISLNTFPPPLAVPATFGNFGTGLLAVDDASHGLWVVNTSDGGHSVLRLSTSGGAAVKVNTTIGAITAVGVDPTTSSFLAAESASCAVTLGVDGLETWNSTTGTARGTWVDACRPGFPSFDRLIPVPLGSTRGWIASGTADYTTSRLAYSGTGAVYPDLNYSSFPVITRVVAGSGSVLVQTSVGLTDLNETTGATLWTNASFGSICSGPILPDAARSWLLFANSCVGQITLLNASSGREVGSAPSNLMGGVTSLALDPARGLIYVGGNQDGNVSIFSANSSGLSVAGKIPIPAGTVCALGADSALGTVFVSSCLQTGNVTEIDPVRLLTVRNISVGPVTPLLWANGSGDLFVGDAGGQSITVYNATTGARLSYWVVPSLQFSMSGFAVDSADNIAYAFPVDGGSVAVFNVSRGSYMGVIGSTGASLSGGAFDSTTGVASLSVSATDQIFTIRVVSPSTVQGQGPGSSPPLPWLLFIGIGVAATAVAVGALLARRRSHASAPTATREGVGSVPPAEVDSPTPTDELYPR